MKAKLILPLLATALLLAVGPVAATTTSKLSLGYRVTDSKDQPNRAAEYYKLKDSVVGTAKISDLSGRRHFSFEGTYLNEDDYSGELHFDQAGLLRINLFGESIYHNLDHIPYPAPIETVNSPTGGTALFREDLNPGDDYHLDVHQSSAHVRAKLPSFPAHINLNYWRLDRRGKKQLRFLDESCSGCHLQSRSQNVNRVTEEFTGSIDAHIGPIDLIFEQLVRIFRDEEPLLVDAFDRHNYRTSNDAALLVHDENPDSRLVASTVKAHTSLSGGLNGAAAVTLGTRTNQSRINTLGPVEAETDFIKTSGDITYIPAPNLTFNLRYRLLDMNTSNSDVQVLTDLTTPPNTAGANALPSIAVRDSIDLTTAVYNATGTWRPNRQIAIKADLRREDIDRSNTGAAGETGVWLLPEKETRNRLRLSAYVHPAALRGLKFNTRYQYRTSDDPAYATIVARGHEGFAGLTWMPSSGSWGLSLNGRVARASNDEHSIFQPSATPGIETEYPIHRRSEDDNIGAGIWFTPKDRINCTLSYGYIRNRIVQDLVFGMDSANNLVVPDDDVEYTQHVHSAVLAANWQLAQRLALIGEGHISWSKARFNPQFDVQMTGFNPTAVNATAFTVNSDGLREFSALDTRQMGFVAGVDWEPVDTWTCLARYSYDNYQDQLGDEFDGSAQTVTLSVAKAW